MIDVKMINVKLFDPHLEFVKDLNPKGDRTHLISIGAPLGKRVYQVSLEGRLYVLKIASRGEKDNVNVEELIKEKRVLERAKSIDGITHLVDCYSPASEYVALLKEYAEGTDLKSLGYKFDRFRIKQKLKHTIASFHNLGIACLDVSDDNIIISPNEKNVKLIDFDIAFFREECVPRLFDSYKREDYSDLEKAFSYERT